MDTLTLINILLIAFLLMTCTPSNQERIVYVGTYTGNGSEGIYAYRFDATRGELKPEGLVAKTENPSFLTIDKDGRFLYAVNEVDSFNNESAGAVSVFSIAKPSGKLNALQQVSSQGAAPCHITLDKSGRYLLVANYNGGNAIVYPIEGDGKLGPHSAFIQSSGSSVNPDRQTGPHAHFIQTTSDNKFAMIADLGIDQVLVHAFDDSTGTLTPIDSGNVRLEPGSGPRHLAYGPSGKFVFVLNELTATVATFSWDSKTGTMQPLQTITTLPADFSGMNTSAEIAVHPNGKFLYVSNRGADGISIFNIERDGRLTSLGWISSGGKAPRHFEIDPTGQWLMVANQNSNNIVLFKVDQENGQLVKTSELTGIYSPVCVKFLSLE